MVEFTTDFQRFLSGYRLSYTSGYIPLRNRSKRPPVLQDQKVLLEVRNRLLLPKENFKSRALKKMVASPIGEPAVSPFQYPIYLWLQAAA